MNQTNERSGYFHNVIRCKGSRSSLDPLKELRHVTVIATHVSHNSWPSVVAPYFIKRLSHIKQTNGYTGVHYLRPRHPWRPDVVNGGKCGKLGYSLPRAPPQQNRANTAVYGSVDLFGYGRAVIGAGH